MLVALLAPGLLRLDRRPCLGLSLVAMRMRALLLRMLGAGPLVPPLLVALLLPTETAAIPPSMRLLCLVLSLALSALLRAAIFAFAAWTLALDALVAPAARASLGSCCRQCGWRSRRQTSTPHPSNCSN